MKATRWYVVVLAIAVGCAGGTEESVVGDVPVDTVQDTTVAPDTRDTQPVSQCGNGYCEAGETSASCPSDCAPAQPVCGNGTCETGEDSTSCPNDCAPPHECGNGTCESGETFQCSDCATCGCNAAAYVCEVDGQCTTQACACDPDCSGGQPCASDGSCDPRCPTDTDPDCAGHANNGKYCGSTGPECGNGVCEVGETAQCPDCAGCPCNALALVCDVAAHCSKAACTCDPDCASSTPCKGEGTCDPMCPTDTDPDCLGNADLNGKYCGTHGPQCGNGTCEPGETQYCEDCADCSCDFMPWVCEASQKCSEVACDCDADCDVSAICSEDGFCDSWCPKDKDPDCAEHPLNGQFCGPATSCGNGICEVGETVECADCTGCSCNSVANVCEANQKCSSDDCTCDPDCEQKDACSQDGQCDSWCTTDADPDCAGKPDNGKYCQPTTGCGNGICEPGETISCADCSSCDCNWVAHVCEAADQCSTSTCACDPDCAEGTACSQDGHCDSWCTTDADPDCAGDTKNGMYCGTSCTCDYYSICEASEKCSTEKCTCDPDCADSDACVADGRCDSWCTTDADPDCAGHDNNGKYCDECSCDYYPICEASEKCTTEKCTCDPDCADSDACVADGRCDSWCTTDADPDCAGHANNGAYCN